ncbi:helix-turn-helix DNA binding domain protein [Mycobacterium phage phiGD22-1]|nr:helix-turn-helix DNA binding domain protein [Mycobacterium phage phiGD22-1]
MPRAGEFTAEAKELMLERSLGECEVQWPNVCVQTVESYHHRRPRGRGGRVSNGLAICRGCHSFIETRERGKAIELGFIVSQWQEPAFERVFYRHERWVWLADDGSIREERAA